MSVRTRIGEFDVVGTLGSGGHGVVYQCRDSHGLEWVVKPVGEPASPVEEAIRKVREITHPNLLPIERLIEDEGRFVIMKYVRGDDIISYFQKSRAALAQRAAKNALILRRVSLDVFRALDALHTHGVVHRDLRPSNIMVTGGKAIIMDVGLDSGAIISRSYLAPELFSNPARITAKCDMYSVGAILYHVISGNAPSGSAVGRLHVDKPFRDLADLAYECLQTDPTDRPTATAALQLLGGPWAGDFSPIPVPEMSDEDGHGDPGSFDGPKWGGRRDDEDDAKVLTARRNEHDLAMSRRSARLAANMILVLVIGMLTMSVGLGAHFWGSISLEVLFACLAAIMATGVAIATKIWGDKIASRIEQNQAKHG